MILNSQEKKIYEQLIGQQEEGDCPNCKNNVKLEFVKDAKMKCKSCNAIIPIDEGDLKRLFKMLKELGVS